MLILVLVLRLELLMNHMGIYEEDNIGSSVGSFDSIKYGKNSVGSLLESISNKSLDAEVGEIRTWSMNMSSGHRMYFNLRKIL